jgi:hypothetical protein
VNPTWHIALVKYGMWTWAPSEEALLYMLAILKSERAARQRYFERFGDAPWRKFVPTVRLFSHCRKALRSYSVSGLPQTFSSSNHGFFFPRFSYFPTNPFFVGKPTNSVPSIRGMMATYMMWMATVYCHFLLRG